MKKKETTVVILTPQYCVFSEETSNTNLKSLV